MDVIPTFELIATIIVGGLLFFFLNLGVGSVIGALTISNIYFSKGIFLWSIVPVAIFMGTSINYIMKMQKRRTLQ